MKGSSGRKAAALLFALASAPVFSQTINKDPLRYDPAEFPQWARDIRRFDVVALGSFPFAFFTATFVSDAMRWSENKWETAYAPWPLKPASAYETTDDEKLSILGASFAIAIGIAVIDFAIVSIKRYKKPPAAPDPVVIKRTPADGEETQTTPDG